MGIKIPAPKNNFHPNPTLPLKIKKKITGGNNITRCPSLFLWFLYFWCWFPFCLGFSKRESKKQLGVVWFIIEEQKRNRDEGNNLDIASQITPHKTTLVTFYSIHLIFCENFAYALLYSAYFAEKKLIQWLTILSKRNLFNRFLFRGFIQLLKL